MNTRETINNNFLRYIKYSFVGFMGFIVVEALSFVTIEAHFDEIVGVTGAYMVSIAVTFIINSKFTVRSKSYRRPKVPVDKFHLFVISGILANAGYILFQYFLYSDFGLTPLIGNLLGGMFITPTNYYYRMKKVWDRKVIF